MRKIILIIIISLLVFGCRTKKTFKNSIKETEKIESTSKTETKEIEISKEVKKEEIKEVKKEEKIDEKQDIEIKGKVDKENPITFFNVVDGDTIDLFKITGNADFIYKASRSSENSSKNNNSSTNTTNENKSEKSSSNLVDKASEVAKDFQAKSVQVVKKDFNIGTYITFILWGLAIIASIAIVFYLRKSNFFSDIWERLNNKL